MRNKSKVEQDRAAAGIIRLRRVKLNKKQSSSRDNKIKNSKAEQEDRAAAGIIRLRRVKWNKKTEQQQGLYEKEE